MSRCCCGFLLAVLVIVFAWWKVSWAPIALTVIGAILAIKALAGGCCCEMMKKYCQEKEQGEQQQTQE